ncbi:MAG: glycerol-3-phosphate 1-O-acyltransferase PlsY [Alphaproteobacteria bacterium]|nr:glycerol-3-phosphate 1-O-acyltransferase PlsY [Alphaproteobacteria bacterium]
MIELVLVIMAYLIGSIPTAVIISKKVSNIDIRDYGSGNAGTTNTLRILGKKWAVVVLILDVLKGLLATSLWIFVPNYNVYDNDRMNFMIVLGLAGVFGHIFPIFAQFKGGKGVATLLGMAIAIQPIVALICLIVFIIILSLTKFVSLSSILSAIAFMVLVVFIFKEKVILYKIFAILVALTVVLTHQKNIQKLIKGEENKINLKNKKK